MESAGGAGGGEGDDEPAWNCTVHPSIFFLLGTLVLTTCATSMLCGAIMTDHWEEVTWDKATLAQLVGGSSVGSSIARGDDNHLHNTHRADFAINNSTIHLQWLLDGTVARVTNRTVVTSTTVTSRGNSNNNGGIERYEDTLIAFLVPMHGGIWTLCVSLTEEEISLLGRVGFPQVQPCVNYLAGGPEGVKGYEPRAAWQHRMQNLSISCALVCLIVLGSAALVGAFGVCHHQISAVLVTGVMYLLAASFALFTLTIIHFKRVHNRPRGLEVDTDSTVDGVVVIMHRAALHLMSGGATGSGGSGGNGWADITTTAGRGGGGTDSLLAARLFSTSWSLDLGWGGVTLCVLTSVMWILLSKIMRFNPLSTMVN